MLASISSVLNVLPGFGYYDDGDSHNAYASPRIRAGRTDGTVLFGLGLLRDKLNEQAGGSRVAAVCAHEFSHVVQFKHNIQSRIRNGQPTVKPIELHADFLAGYFAARHREDNPSFPAAEFAMSQYKGGDPYVGQEDHHGTREERGAAVEAGYKARKHEVSICPKRSKEVSSTLRDPTKRWYTLPVETPSQVHWKRVAFLACSESFTISSWDTSFSTTWRYWSNPSRKARTSLLIRGRLM